MHQSKRAPRQARVTQKGRGGCRSHHHRHRPVQDAAGILGRDCPSRLSSRRGSCTRTERP
eukprot:6204641-Pleurochrysis_carterae.AAC.3